MEPSIGNWSFACRSHYWIEEGRVRSARGFSTQEVALVRSKARSRRDGYDSGGRAEPVTGPRPDEGELGGVRALGQRIGEGPSGVVLPGEGLAWGGAGRRRMHEDRVRQTEFEVGTALMPANGRDPGVANTAAKHSGTDIHRRVTCAPPAAPRLSSANSPARRLHAQPSRSGADRRRPGWSPREGPRGRARVRPAPQRGRGYQENAPSSIERR